MKPKLLSLNIFFFCGGSLLFAQEKPVEAGKPSAPAEASKPKPETTQASPKSETPPATNNTATTPQAPKSDSAIAPVAPATPPVSPKPINNDSNPAQPPVKKEEPELDPETKRLIEEAKQKILREKVEKEAADKRQAEEAQRKKEAEKSFFGNLAANSKFFPGIAGGVGLPLNSVHGLGFGGAVTLDYIAFKHYGLHLAGGTGVYPTKSLKLTSGSFTATIPDNGSYGFLSVDAALTYSFTEIAGISIATGLGGNFYQLKGGTYSFGSMISPLAVISAHYKIFWNLQIGILAKMALPTSKTLKVTDTANSGEYTLDSDTSLTQMSTQLSIRYAFWGD